MACSKLEAIAIFVVNQAYGNDIGVGVYLADKSGLHLQRDGQKHLVLFIIPC